MSKVIIFLLTSTLFTASCTHQGERITKNSFYKKLDQIREHKYHEISQYMSHVQAKADGISKDQNMKHFFSKKRNLFYKYKSNTASKPDIIKLLKLRDSIQELYIDSYLLFQDILFIDLNGDIFYTVKRQGDYHKNLFEGTLSQTELSKHLKAKPRETYVDFQDYEFSNSPSAFFVEPNMDNEKLKGWFVMQFSIQKLNEMFSIEESLGQTGEVFLVNKDCYMLTDSRFFADSTVLKQHLSDANIRAKFREKVGRKSVTDYRGYKAMTSFKVMNILGSEWLLIAKIDEDEVLTEQYKESRNQSSAAILSLVFNSNQSLIPTSAPPPA